MAKFSVRKPFTVFVAVIIVIILGVVSFINMTPDLLPSIEMPMAIIVTTYPGASPAEVEAEVTKPLEQSMATLENIKSVSSTSSDSVSMIMLEFNDGVNMDTVTVNMREKIELVRSGWGDMVSNPFILKINPDILPVTVAAVDYSGMSTVDLSTFANDELVPKLEGTEGVASITATGLVEESVYVMLNADLIAQQNERIQEAVIEQFGEYEAQIRSGVGGAYSGLNAANAGKEQLAAGQEQLARELYATRLSLEEGRRQLVAMQVAGAAITPFYSEVQSRQAQNTSIRQGIEAANPGATASEIDALCAADTT